MDLRARASAGLAAEPCGQGIFKLGVRVRTRNRASTRLRPATIVGSAKGARESGRVALNSGDYLNIEGRGFDSRVPTPLKRFGWTPALRMSISYLLWER